jgi:hypothetical protein
VSPPLDTQDPYCFPMPLTTERPPKDGTLLFHYTTLDGMLGIFDSWSLWGTDVRFLNDFREFEHEKALLTRGASRALELVADEIASDPEQKLRRHIQGITRMLEPWPSEQVREAIYVACFCEDGDLLSQWRGYGTAGVSLGFLPEQLESLPRPPKPILTKQQVERGGVWLGDLDDSFRPRFVKVHYGDPKPEHFDEFAQSVVAEARRRVERTETGGLHGNVQTDFVALVARFKDPAFEEEREHRLVLNGSVHTSSLDRFRVGPLGPVPYAEIPVDLDQSLRWIVIGPPRASHDGREKAILRLLKHHDLDGLHDVNVSHSEIPFR